MSGPAQSLTDDESWICNLATWVLMVILGSARQVIAAVVAIDDIVLSHGIEQHLLPHPVPVLSLQHDQGQQAQDCKSPEDPLGNDETRAVHVAAPFVVAIGITAVPVVTLWGPTAAAIHIRAFDAHVGVCGINIVAVAVVDTVAWIRVVNGTHDDAGNSQGKADCEDDASGRAPEEGFLWAHVHLQRFVYLYYTWDKIYAI